MVQADHLVALPRVFPLKKGDSICSRDFRQKPSKTRVFLRVVVLCINSTNGKLAVRGPVAWDLRPTPK